jgi:hypothetical protein
MTSGNHDTWPDEMSLPVAGGCRYRSVGQLVDLEHGICGEQDIMDVGGIRVYFVCIVITSLLFDSQVM